MKNIGKTNIILLILFSAIIVWFKFSFHELWKDEWQAYLVARDMSLGEMFSFLNYEGHPALWYIFLKVTSLWSNLFTPYEENLIQAGHSILVLLTFYLLFIKIKAPIWLKLGLASSYFIAFQYGIVNRGYILILLFGLLAIIELKKDNRSFPFLLYIFLLCQTEVYGVFVAGSIVLYKILQQNGNFINKIKESKYTITSLSLGLLTFVITVYPRGHKDDFSRAYNQEFLSLDKFLLSFQGNTVNAFLPGLVTDTQQAGWSLMGVFLGLLTLLLLVLIFRKNKPAMFSMMAMLLVMVIFGTFIYSGGIRQWGASFLCFAILVCLLAKGSWDQMSITAFTIISLVQAIHMGRAMERDFRLPFSITQQVGEFVKEKVPEKVPVVAINKFETAAIGAYADRPLFELPSGQQFTYFKWLEKVYMPTQKEINLFAKFKNVGGIVLVSPAPIDRNRFPNAVLWKKFDEPTYKLEKMYLYSIPVK